jgi:hypothetical protein
MTRESVVINVGRGGNDRHRRANLRLGPRRCQPELPARAHVAGADRAQG